MSGSYLSTADQSSGIRNDLAFEALTLSPNGRRLFVGTENALYQDGPAADLYTGSPSRAGRLTSTATGGPVGEYTYRTEPVQDATSPADAFANNGLMELLALDDRGTLLALERSFSTGVAGNDIRLFVARPDPGGVDASGRVPLRKELVLDFDELGITLDNLEGMTSGPTCLTAAAPWCWSRTTTSPKRGSPSSSASGSTSSGSARRRRRGSPRSIPASGDLGGRGAPWQPSAPQPGGPLVGTAYLARLGWPFIAGVVANALAERITERLVRMAVAALI